MEEPREEHKASTKFIELPAPTAWPFVLAFGLTLAFLGLVTSAGISILGAVLVVSGGIGWFRDVLPEEQHERVPVRIEEIEQPVSIRRTVARIYLAGVHRAHLPLSTPSIQAGIKGGIAGGIAMIIPAELFGIIAYHSIWYPVNLLGGAGVAEWTNPSLAEITHFRLSALITATVIHIALSLLVGLLYGAMLPMLPRHPMILGGLIAPALWTGLLHSSLGLIDPYLDQKVHWVWFAASQVAFGLVAGWVVAHQTHIRVAQSLPFAARVGLETPGLMGEPKPREDERR